MAVTFVGASVGSNASVGVSIPVPTDTQVGDLLLVLVGTSGEGYTHIVPSGWALLDTAITGSQTSTTLSKIVDASDLSSGNIVVEHTPTGGPKDIGIAAAFRGELLTPQIDVHGISPQTTAAAEMPLPVLSTTQPDALLIAAAVRKYGSAEITFTDPAGSTRLQFDPEDGGGSIAGVMVSIPQATPGQTSVGDFVAAPDPSGTAGNTFLVALYEGEPPPLARGVVRRWTIQGWYPPREL